MPIYEYRCDKCERLYDQLEPANAPREQPCIEPNCGGLAKRVLSVIAKPASNSTNISPTSPPESSDMQHGDTYLRDPQYGTVTFKKGTPTCEIIEQAVNLDNGRYRPGSEGYEILKEVLSIRERHLVKRRK